MNLNQIVYELTYWFDYGMHMVLNHPLISAAAVLGAFLFHQTVGAIKTHIQLWPSCDYGYYLTDADVLS
jgi:hypothetical protein